MGGSDLRKLTALLYLQPPGKDMSDLGGCFCAHDVDGERESERCFEPICDRMVIFWSDALVHHVSPSFAPAGQQDHRWALTTWFISDDTRGGHIRTTSEDVEGRHFGTG
uniref:Prolyl 4-hydroxylase alpha subunit Fe(2+) 2OG dioxygenase domain-containing protein n=1 Tax=Attheya septentrionalis TaxID=420275 RepID=A0A7S2XR82_9STRA